MLRCYLMDPDTDVCQTEQPQISYSVDFIAEQSSAMGSPNLLDREGTTVGSTRVGILKILKPQYFISSVNSRGLGGLFNFNFQSSFLLFMILLSRLILSHHHPIIHHAILHGVAASRFRRAQRSPAEHPKYTWDWSS